MNNQNTKRKPIKASEKRKEELIQGVVREGKPIIYIAKKLRMKYTVARRIIKQYKEKEGLLPEQGTQNRSRDIISSLAMQNQRERAINNLPSISQNQEENPNFPIYIWSQNNNWQVPVINQFIFYNPYSFQRPFC